MTIKLIVGLSNPGYQYINTRHNAGHWYIESLIKKYSKTTLRQTNKFYGYIGQIVLKDHYARLLIPNTFMNLSGKAVKKIISFYNIEPEEILIAHDELDLLPGNVKLKLGGSHGGHNGLKDIIRHLDNKNQFYRLRIGIGHPGNKSQVKNFVLNEPDITERQIINRAIDKAVICTEILVTDGALKAMNSLHKPFNNNN